MDFKLFRTCKNCQQIDAIKLTEIEAAFELYSFREIGEMPCTTCGSGLCESIARQPLKVNKRLLDMWGKDPGLSFSKQDQAILLAEYDYVPLILQAIDDQKHLKKKTEVLIEALCTLLYDNTVEAEEFPEERKDREMIAGSLRPELVKRKAKIREADGIIMDHVKEIVYPQIGLS